MYQWDQTDLLRQQAEKAIDDVAIGSLIYIGNWTVQGNL